MKTIKFTLLALCLFSLTFCSNKLPFYKATVAYSFKNQFSDEYCYMLLPIPDTTITDKLLSPEMGKDTFIVDTTKYIEYYTFDSTFRKNDTIMFRIKGNKPRIMRKHTFEYKPNQN